MYRRTSTCLKGPVSQSRTGKQDVSSDEFLKTTHHGQAATIPGTEAGIRHELVARVRRQIASGIYDTPEKWEMALDRLLEQIDQT